jgi:hypothetical protein
VDAGRALFGYVRSESRLLERLLVDPAYRNSSGSTGTAGNHGRGQQIGASEAGNEAAMSIYATLWQLQFPSHGDEYEGCE